MCLKITQALVVLTVHCNLAKRIWLFNLVKSFLDKKTLLDFNRSQRYILLSCNTKIRKKNIDMNCGLLLYVCLFVCLYLYALSVCIIIFLKQTLMNAVQVKPGVPMAVSTCWAPLAVCVIRVLNSVLMANSATVSKERKHNNTLKEYLIHINCMNKQQMTHLDN